MRSTDLCTQNYSRPLHPEKSYRFLAFKSKVHVWGHHRRGWVSSCHSSMNARNDSNLHADSCLYKYNTVTAVIYTSTFGVFFCLFLTDRKKRFKTAYSLPKEALWIPAVSLLYMQKNHKHYTCQGTTLACQ